MIWAAPKNGSFRPILETTFFWDGHFKVNFVISGYNAETNVSRSAKSFATKCSTLTLRNVHFVLAKLLLVNFVFTFMQQISTSNHFYLEQCSNYAHKIYLSPSRVTFLYSCLKHTCTLYTFINLFTVPLDFCICSLMNCNFCV